jgi:hypothetical protein
MVERTESGVMPKGKAAATALHAKVEINAGQAVQSIMNLPCYRKLTLADLMPIVLDPLMRDTDAAGSGAAKPQMFQPQNSAKVN